MNRKQSATKMVNDWADAYYESDPQTSTLLSILNVDLSPKQINQIERLTDLSADVALKEYNEDEERKNLKSILL